MSVVDDVKTRLDIVDVVSGYVSLQKAGRNFKAPCPFHDEKTPSFIVNPERQSWHCFGACSTGGDVFSFIQRADNLDFGEALRSLAQKAGVEITRAGEDGQSRGRHELLYQANGEAAKFYRDVLASDKGEKAQSYLDKRGVDASATANFELGLSPDGWEGLKSHLLSLGVEEDVAVEAGLLRRNENGQTRDFFHGRLMFPIHDRRGRVAGFGGRSLDGSDPKYINTAATPVFDKRSMLYGMHLANKTIKDSNTGVVVEGYMDVIAAHQHGYTNVVASMGTALTENQVGQLRPLAKSFVLALDPDVAGQEATLRSLESSWRVIGRRSAGRSTSAGVLYQRDPIVLKIASLPDGRDPDELIRHDTKAWEDITENALPLMDFLIPTVASRFDLNTGQGKTQLKDAVFPLIAATENFFDQEKYMEQLAGAMHVTIEQLKASLPRGNRAGADRTRARSERPPGQEEDASALMKNPGSVIDEYVLSLILNRPELKKQVSAYPAELFRNTEDREVFTRWLACSTIDDLRESLDDALGERLSYLTEMQHAPSDRAQSERALLQCMRRLESRHWRERQQSLLVSVEADQPASRDIEEDIVEANSRIRETFQP
ncbi:MAG: DNA primase [Chloroflexi bacterium]|nr:DNA primase [Chloroflexota bacterium]